MKFVTVNLCKYQFHFTPEMKAHMRMVDDPQDLNEALVSVRHDAFVDRAQKAIADELNERFEAMLIQSLAAQNLKI
jgi:hypothetical protein